MSVGMLPLLLSLVFPACGKTGAAGVKPLGIIDFTHFSLPKTPNKALGAPAGFTPAPTLTTPVYKLSPVALFAVVKDVANAAPRTYALDTYTAQFQAAWVVRSARANFPDVIAVAVRPDASGGSKLILYSRSIYGQSDFGVNAARLKTWLSAIGSKAGTASN